MQFCPTLGPRLANLFLTYYEDGWLDNCPIQFRPRYYRRYDITQNNMSKHDTTRHNASNTGDITSLIQHNTDTTLPNMSTKEVRSAKAFVTEQYIFLNSFKNC